MYVRGNKKDYDQWAEEGAKGWSYEDVLPYFKKMEDNRDENYILNGDDFINLHSIMFIDKAIIRVIIFPTK